MKEFASGLYTSPEWERCRAGYLKLVGCLCERCKAQGRITPAKIVHHKIYLTPSNINDPRITLDYRNLEALCKQCHEEEHNFCGRKQQRRYSVDDAGNIIGIDL